MDWDDLEIKFIAICEPIFGTREANILFNALRNFERAGALQKVVSIIVNELMIAILFLKVGLVVK